MTLRNVLFQSIAAWFYRLAQTLVVSVNKNLKTTFDDFWMTVEDILGADDAEKPLESQSIEMVEGIFDLKETKVREIMVPRTELTAVRVSDSIEKVAAVIHEKGHSRILVFEDNIDNIIGVLHVKDVFQEMAMNQGREISIERIMREPYFVPETKSVFDLLQEMKGKKMHLAVVIDEYGGIAGIVTLEDLIEEIIGEVQDEYDNEKDPIVKLDDRTWHVDAKMTIDDLNRELGLDIPQDEDYDTLAGYILATLGRIPGHKERIEANGVIFVVMEASEKSIEKVKIITPAAPVEDEKNADEEGQGGAGRAS